MPRICVFTGSSPGARAEYALAAEQFGRELVARGYGLVYGGGKVGLMGALADAVLDSGGTVIGVIPKVLLAKEVAHGRLTELRVVASMHERKAMMADLADAFVALPGGLGTLEELCEILTWAQLGLHAKPCGLLNVCNYFDGLLAFLDHEEPAPRPDYRGKRTQQSPRWAGCVSATTGREVDRPRKLLSEWRYIPMLKCRRSCMHVNAFHSARFASPSLGTEICVLGELRSSQLRLA